MMLYHSMRWTTLIQLLEYWGGEILCIKVLYCSQNSRNFKHSQANTLHLPIHPPTHQTNNTTQTSTPASTLKATTHCTPQSPLPNLLPLPLNILQFPLRTQYLPQLLKLSHNPMRIHQPFTASYKSICSFLLTITAFFFVREVG